MKLQAGIVGSLKSQLAALAAMIADRRRTPAPRRTRHTRVSTADKAANFFRVRLGE